MHLIPVMNLQQKQNFVWTEFFVQLMFVIVITFIGNLSE